MELINRTVLITGGSSGIGLELAKKLINKGNKVIICGRSLTKLQRAKEFLPEVSFFQCDISKASQCEKLIAWIGAQHPGLDVLINNAAIVHKTNFAKDEAMLEKCDAEIKTNLLAPIRLIKMLLPLLEKNKHSIIINVTTGLVYAPRADYPIYNATKSALHSFTQVLRIQLQSSNIRVIEVLFPAVDTPWHQGAAPKIAISPERAVDEMMKGLKKGKDEIRIAGVRILRFLSRVAPSFAVKKINQLANS